MKTMTCRQLGGPCDLEHRGATHQEAREAMKGRWRRPKKSLDWYFGVKQAFADLPEDATSPR